MSISYIFKYLYYYYIFLLYIYRKREREKLFSLQFSRESHSSTFFCQFPTFLVVNFPQVYFVSYKYFNFPTFYILSLNYVMSYCLSLLSFAKLFFGFSFISLKLFQSLNCWSVNVLLKTVDAVQHLARANAVNFPSFSLSLLYI